MTRQNKTVHQSFAIFREKIFRVPFHILLDSETKTWLFQIEVEIRNFTMVVE